MSALHLSWARLDKVSQAGQSQDIYHDGENNFYLAHLAPNCQETSVSLSRFPCPPSLRVGSLEDRGGSWHESGHSGYLEYQLIPQTITMCSDSALSSEMFSETVCNWNKKLKIFNGVKLTEGYSLWIQFPLFSMCGIMKFCHGESKTHSTFHLFVCLHGWIFFQEILIMLFQPFSKTLYFWLPPPPYFPESVTKNQILDPFLSTFRKNHFSHLKSPKKYNKSAKK